MRHGARSLRNFYEDDDGDEPTRKVISERRLSSPRLFDHTAAASGFSVRVRHSTAVREPRHIDPPCQVKEDAVEKKASRSCSSASVECVLPCSEMPQYAAGLASSSPSPTATYNAAAVSLRELFERVEESIEDLHRLDALMCKAVWHALSQEHQHHQQQRAKGASGGARLRHQSSAQSRADHLEGAAPDAAPRRGRHKIAATNDRENLREPATVSHLKPFLPPDRFPATPPLQGTPDHLRINLSHAVYAAQRAGFLERGRAWWRRRGAYSGDEVPSIEMSSSPLGFSLHQEALRRISGLTRGSSDRCRTSPMTDQDVLKTEEEQRVHSSVSLIILRLAKARAIATLFLRQLRLEVHKRRAIGEEVELRYCYYVQRRLLRHWNEAAALQRSWRRYTTQQIVLHWQRYARMRAAVHRLLCTWRQQLQQRARAYAWCLMMRRRRCFQLWVQAFLWHRERSALYEKAAVFARSWRRPHAGSALGVTGTQEVCNYLCGRPHVTSNCSSGDIAVTAVGSRLVLLRLFHAWRRRTEHRLMRHLADWSRAQHLRACVVHRMTRCGRRVLLQHHRTDGTCKLRQSTKPQEEKAVVDDVLDGQLRAPLRFYMVTVVPKELRKYKTSAASRLSHAVGLRRSYDRWRSRFARRRADRFYLRHVYAHALGCWLHALAARNTQRLWKEMIFSHWARLMYHRRDTVVAVGHRTQRVTRHVFVVWRGCATSQQARRTQLLQACLERWRTATAVRRADRVLRRVRQRGSLLRWHAHAQLRVSQRTNILVADTIYETALMLGCTRRWRIRAGGRHRDNLAWEVLAQLRQERIARKCFDIWCQRTFGPRSTGKAARATLEPPSSPAISLLD